MHGDAVKDIKIITVEMAQFGFSPTFFLLYWRQICNL
jgi:hypothetical protein